MLRIIATFILIYLIFRFVTAVIFPLIARWYLKRYQRKFYRNNPEAAKAGERRKQEGVHIRQGKQGDKPQTSKLGEYVDFEEINDHDNIDNNNHRQ